jgi:sporulation protein YlmC with PRC-barrel domain
MKILPTFALVLLLPLAVQAQNRTPPTEAVGTMVLDSGGKTIGTVANVIYDVENLRIAALLVSHGGFLGIGEKKTAVPPTTFVSFDAPRKIAKVNFTKETFLSAPDTTLADWTGLQNAHSVDATYRHFGVTPYFSGARPANYKSGWSAVGRNIGLDGGKLALGKLMPGVEILQLPVVTNTGMALGKVSLISINIPLGRLNSLTISRPNGSLFATSVDPLDCHYSPQFKALVWDKITN